MKTIPLTQGLETTVDDADYDHLAAFTWHATRNARKRRWYAARNVAKACGGQTKVRMHRAILNAPPGVDVDHKDGDGLNNRRDNLRLATKTQNQQNRSLNHKPTVTGYKGVSYVAHGIKRYVARIYRNNTQINLGLFLAAEEAARAYDSKARELFGEFARLNFPS